MKNIVLIFLSLILTACLPSEQKNIKPSKMVDKITFQQITKELLIIETKKKAYNQEVWSSGNQTVPLFPDQPFIRQVLKKYHLSKEQYKENMIYYSQDLKDLKKIYESIAK